MKPEIKEYIEVIQKQAEQMLDKPILEIKEIEALNEQLDQTLAKLGVHKRYFRRLT